MLSSLQCRKPGADIVFLIELGFEHSYGLYIVMACIFFVVWDDHMVKLCVCVCVGGGAPSRAASTDVDRLVMANIVMANIVMDTFSTS